MIRPEVVALFRRWAEPAIALGGTLIALWIVGATNLRWGWLSLALAAIITVSGGLWVREAIRRVRFATGDASGAGRVFVEEQRILYVGGLGNIQIELRDVNRVDIAVSKSGGSANASVLLYTESGLPAAIPLNAEGHDAFIDALCSLPDFRFDALSAAISEQKAAESSAPIITFWRRKALR